MSLHSRLFDHLKSVDALLGVPAARRLARRATPLPARPRDVLVLRLWGLGNLALLAPQLEHCRDTTRLRLLTLERNGDFVRHHFPWVKPLLVPDPTSLRWPFALLRHLAAVRADPPDVIVDLEQFLRLPLLAVRLASGAPAVGLDTPGQERGPLLDRPVRHDPTRHVADTFATIWSAAGLPAVSGPGPLRMAPEALDVPLLRGHGPLIVLHPGSGDHFPGRRWPAPRFGQLANRLRRLRGARLVVTGQRGERPSVRRLLEACDIPVQDLSERLDTRALVALLARADLLVTNDTGPLHLADAVGTRAVALYGPNTPHRYGPRLPGSRAVFADLPCSPCLDDRSMKRSHCRHHVCMEVLSVALVEQACLAALDASDPAPITADPHHALAH